YHSAKFISTSPSVLKKKFYSIAKQNIHKYKVELDFLSVIDEHCYEKHLLLPMYEDILKNVTLNGNLEKTNISEQLSGAKLYFDEEYRSPTSFHLSDKELFESDYISQAYNKIIKLTIKLINQSETDKETLNKNNEKSICLVALFKEKGIEDEANEILNEELKIIFNKYNELKITLNKKEDMIAELNF
ncbi:hypothetical protein NTE29_005107, partial [Vibrio harveyi]|nr:hypothetical protein [Vibrio harveyi]